jgi:hypothetical protein
MAKRLREDKSVNQTENRVMVKDSYRNKLYEIIQENGTLSGYDYTLARCLKEEEAAAVVLRVTSEQKGWERVFAGDKATKNK